MKTLTFNDTQFEVLYDIVEDAISDLKNDLDDDVLYTTETYKIYHQLNVLREHTLHV